MAALFGRSSRTQAPDQWDSGNRLAIDAFPPEVVSGLRRMITQAVAFDRLPARLALTSALSGEGVTYTALTMATTLASDMRKKVCVVELNWRAPGMVRLLRSPAPQRRRLPWRKPLPEIDSSHIPDSPGLAGILQGEASLHTALLPTMLPNMALLPAGDMPDYLRPGMARSPELRELIGSLGQYFDHVLLDVPALLSTSDAMALASLAESCYLVVRHGVTSVADIRQALEDIQHLHVPGLLLNRVQLHTPAAIQRLMPQEELK
jgi:Mrp family chromosome partitioning ATPase